MWADLLIHAPFVNLCSLFRRQFRLTGGTTTSQRRVDQSCPLMSGAIYGYGTAVEPDWRSYSYEHSAHGWANYAHSADYSVSDEIHLVSINSSTRPTDYRSGAWLCLWFFTTVSQSTSDDEPDKYEIFGAYLQILSFRILTNSEESL